ncbi:hypothetical protein MAPG_10612 [Magnaporthiopsis poae ATCC 64411]|uniref:RGS domain-containing protein n=1 Tax=Magnaporthiopsis poae (strain ATCC 64411 / 73-15) TaxID=644358 RepID=A0A0C4ED20_MAGP6|nr:hypothetical protein MAPG_10612 [Magnaporthiopsis poae ATCC 64411]
MAIPSWMIWYKKPEYRDIREYSAQISTGQRCFSPDGRARLAIPNRLRLERILANKTCSPMSLYDFYMYLKYIEFSPENLEFYVWFKNYELAYEKAMKSKAAEQLTEKELEAIEPAPESREGSVFAQALGKLPSVNMSHMSWDPEMGPDTLAHIAQLISLNVTLRATVDGMGDLMPPQPKCAGGQCLPEKPGSSDAPSRVTSSIFTSNLGPSAELRAVVKTYLLPGSEKELNIPASMRNTALQALHKHQAHAATVAASAGSSSSLPTVSSEAAETAGYIDPEVLRPVADHAYMLLRNCSHRNFVRLGVSNGTYETVCVATALGIVLTAVGFLLLLLRAFQPGTGAHSRWEAFAAWPLWWLGMSLVLSGLRGSCFFLLLFSRRQPLPWERFDDGDGIEHPGSNGTGNGNGVNGNGNDNVTKTGSSNGSGTNFSSTGTASKIAKPSSPTATAEIRRKRNPVLRALSRLMIFDRKLKVKDEHLRRLQTKIVVQSLASGAVFATMGVLLFLWLPVWTETVR